MNGLEMTQVLICNKVSFYINVYSNEKRFYQKPREKDILIKIKKINKEREKDIEKSKWKNLITIISTSSSYI